MTEQGKVIKIEKNEAVVRVENALDAKEGDLVQIKLESGSVAKISLLVYILPLALAVAGMLTGIFCRLPDWANLVLFAGLLAVGFIIVFLLDKKIAKSKKLQPVLLAVLPDGETEQEINKNETITET